MKKMLLLSLVFTACYTEIKKPDHIFMNTIKAEAGLDSNLRTTIEIIPRNYDFGKQKIEQKLTGQFYIKNIGKITFKALSIQSNCDCIVIRYETNLIQPGDSLQVTYTINIQHRTGHISNSIVAIGNCQFGNQTFCVAGTIIHQ